MTANLADRYRRWFEYEKDAHQKTLISLAAVPAEQRSAAWQKAVDLFAHLMAARQMWLFRFGIAKQGPPELFPQNVAFESLDALAAQTQAAWAAYFECLDEAELTRVFEYRSSEGEGYRNTVEDILTQLFGHSWYHRGQVAQLLRGNGNEPAVTDFVFWSRELID